METDGGEAGAPTLLDLHDARDGARLWRWAHRIEFASGIAVSLLGVAAVAASVVLVLGGTIGGIAGLVMALGGGIAMRLGASPIGRSLRYFRFVAGIDAEIEARTGRGGGPRGADAHPSRHPRPGV